MPNPYRPPDISASRQPDILTENRVLAASTLFSDQPPNAREEIEMAEFAYTAYSVDGSHNTKGGIMTAADKQEAEKKIKAQYSYPVRVEFLEDKFPELGRPYQPF